MAGQRQEASSAGAFRPRPRVKEVMPEPAGVWGAILEQGQGWWNREREESWRNRVLREAGPHRRRASPDQSRWEEVRSEQLGGFVLSRREAI